MKVELRQRIAVTVGLIVFIAVSLGIAFVAGLFPGPQQACIDRCSKQQKQGQLVYKGPATPKRTADDGECECR
jgi:hypothetical protein